MARKITLADLVAKSACSNAVADFEKEFPSGEVEFTEENFAKSKLFRAHAGWVVAHFFTSQQETRWYQQKRAGHSVDLMDCEACEYNARLAMEIFNEE